MSIRRARELREERAKKVAEARKFIDKPANEVTKEDRAKFDTIMADCDTIKGDIDRLERQAALDAELEEVTRTASNDPVQRQQREQDEVDPTKEAALEVRNKAITLRKQEKYRAAYTDYLRNGLVPSAHERGMSEEHRKLVAEQRDMGVGTGALGGFFVPQGFVQDIESAMKFYGDMLSACSFLDTATGNTLPYPTDNDTTNSGEIVGEASQVADQDVAVGHVTFNAYKFSTKMVKVSLELIQDSAFDIEGFLKDKFAMRLGRIQNNKFTLGSGTNEPTGIITASTAGPTAAGSSNNDGGAGTGANSIGSQDLVELEHSVDKAYRRNAAYMMHDLTIKTLKRLLDKYGRPLWVPGMSSNAPDTINGYRYFVNNDMAQVATTNKTVLFGDLTKYKVRRVKELAIMRLVERYADYGQIAFIGFARGDGNLVDAGTNPVKYLVQA
ncbi:MAG TPA: phage major capsid protein [Candidatus Acidoferrum sp.]|jgi:HK97 family phage major capsid protein|nr:phage major capsid protein [Candidatus Acidoferrum sp.]